MRGDISTLQATLALIGVALLGLLGVIVRTPHGQLISNLSGFARAALGREKVPAWLTDPNADRVVYIATRLGFVALAWWAVFLILDVGTMKPFPFYVIFGGLIAVTIGTVWHLREPVMSTAGRSERQSPISNPLIERTNTGLRLTGIYARSEKNLKYVIEAVLDTQGRGERLGKPFRFKIGETAEAVKGEGFSLPVASYLGQPGSFLSWGGEGVLPPTTENGSFSVTWFVRGKIIAIDSEDNESMITTFVLFPKMDNEDLRNQSRRAVRQIPEVAPQNSPYNQIIYQGGALRALDPAP